MKELYHAPPFEFVGSLGQQIQLLFMIDHWLLWSWLMTQSLYTQNPAEKKWYDLNVSLLMLPIEWRSSSVNSIG